MNRVLTIAVILLVIGLGASSVLAQDHPAESGKEPGLNLKVTVGGETVEVELGEKKSITLNGAETDVQVQRADTRLFQIAELSFEYPSEFTWEASVDKEIYQNWTLSGNDSKVMIFRYNLEESHETLRAMFVKDMMGRYGEGNAVKTGCKVKFGENELSGDQLRVKIADVIIMQQVFSMDVGGAKMLFILQDGLNDDGTEVTNEFKSLLNLLGNTCAFSAEEKAAEAADEPAEDGAAEEAEPVEPAEDDAAGGDSADAEEAPEDGDE